MAGVGQYDSRLRGEAVMVGIDGHDVFEAGDRPVRSHRLIIGLADSRSSLPCSNAGDLHP